MPQLAEPGPPKVRDECPFDVGPLHDCSGRADAPVCLVLSVLDLPCKPRRQPLTNGEPPVVSVLTYGHRNEAVTCTTCGWR
jgi:hypothetical protein